MLSGKKKEEVETALQRLYINNNSNNSSAETYTVDIEQEIESMKVSIQKEQLLNNNDKSDGFSLLFERKSVKALCIGLSLILFQQITGQPSVLYYATTIFQGMMHIVFPPQNEK